MNFIKIGYMNKIKALTALTFAIIIGACMSTPATQENEIPSDLEGLKTLYSSKKVDLKALELKLKTIEAELDRLDTTRKEVATIVRLDTAEQKIFRHFIEFQSSVQAIDIVAASSETGGRIIHLNAQEGDMVKKGSLIAKMDLETIRKSKEEIETRLQLAEQVFERQSRLWEQKIGSEIQYLQAKNNVDALKKSIASIDHQLTRANVYAPISGSIEMVNAKPGEVVSPGMPIVQILNTYNLKVVADIPESYLKNVKKGDKVTVKFPAIEEESTARISKISNVIHPANRTFAAEIRLNNARGKYKPNLLAIMLIQDYRNDDAVVIPQNLIQQDISGQSFVFIATQEDEKMVVHRRKIETGKAYEGNIEITSGLEGGELIIAEGARSIDEGSLIAIEE